MALLTTTPRATLLISCTRCTDDPREAVREELRGTEDPGRLASPERLDVEVSTFVVNQTNDRGRVGPLRSAGLIMVVPPMPGTSNVFLGHMIRRKPRA